MSQIEYFKTIVTVFLIEITLLEVNCAFQLIQINSKDIGEVF